MRLSHFAKISSAALCMLFVVKGFAQQSDSAANDSTTIDNSLPAQNNNNNPPPAPVQPQQRPATPAGGTRIDLRVNNELYGNHNAPGPLYGPQIQPLPSETRLAIQRSGALPSEILINSQAAGPLSPHGAIDYVPDQSTVQKAMGAKPINLWGPAYGPSQQAQTGPISPALQGGTLSSSSNGAFNQTAAGTDTRNIAAGNGVSSLPPSYVNRYVQPQSVSAGYQIRPLNGYRTNIPTETTTIIPLHRIATTKPTTQSIAPPPSEY